MTNKQIIRALKARLRELEQTRDKLRDLESEIVDQLDRAGDAAQSLEYCIERLSEAV